MPIAEPSPPNTMTSAAPANTQTEPSDVIGVPESLKANDPPIAVIMTTTIPTRTDHNASRPMICLLFSPNSRFVDNLDNLRREPKTMEPRRSTLVEPTEELEQYETSAMDECPHGPHEVVQQVSKQQDRPAQYDSHQQVHNEACRRKLDESCDHVERRSQDGRGQCKRKKARVRQHVSKKGANAVGTLNTVQVHKRSND